MIVIKTDSIAELKSHYTMLLYIYRVYRRGQLVARSS